MYATHNLPIGLSPKSCIKIPSRTLTEDLILHRSRSASSISVEYTYCYLEDPQKAIE